MRITRFQATPDGGSCFVDVELDLPHRRTDPEGHVLLGSNAFGSPKVAFSELPEGLDQTWHTAPQRQIVVILHGVLEVTTTDGESRRFSSGEVFLADDVGGKGHLTKAVGGKVHAMFAPMPPEVDLATWLGGP